MDIDGRTKTVKKASIADEGLLQRLGMVETAIQQIKSENKVTAD